MRGLNTIISAFSALLLVGSMTAVAYGQQAVPDKPIKIGWQPSEQAAFFYAQELKLFQAHGLKPEYIRFDAGVPMLAAIEAGNIDVAVIGPPPTLLGIETGVPFKVVYISDDSGGTEGLVVQPGINSFPELKGKKIGVSRGSSADYGLLKTLEKYNMTSADINVVDMQASAMVPAWINKEVDAIYVWEPFVQQLVDLGGSKILSDADVGANGALVWVARDDFIRDSPDTLEAFIEALDVSTRKMRDEGKDLAVKAMMRLMNLTTEQSAAIYEGARYLTLEDQFNPSDPLSMAPEAIKNGNGLVSSYKGYAEFLVSTGRIQSVPDIASGIVPGPASAVLERQKAN